MKNEVILQKSHHSAYDSQLRAVGVRLVTVETLADLRRALSERTALMFFMNVAEPDGRIQRREWVELARRRRVPTLLDAAADVPPVERLSEYKGPLYAMFETEFGTRMIRATEKIRAVAAEPSVADLLQVPAGFPLLSVERVSYTYGDRPVEVRRGWYVTTGYYYQNDLS